MVNEELVAYIRAQTEHGASREDIIHILKTNGGWTDEDILGAFAMVGGAGAQKVETKDSVSEHEKEETKDPLFSQKKGVASVAEKKDEDDDVSILEQAEIHEKKKKRIPLRALFVVIIIVGLGAGGFFAYRTFMTPVDTQIEAGETATEGEVTKEDPETTGLENIEKVYALIERDGAYYVQGKLVLPEEIVEKPTDIMNTSATFDLFPITEEGMFEILVLPDQMNVIAAMLPDKKFGFMKVMGPSDFENNPYALIDAQSSAVALVISSPYLTSEDPKIAESILFAVRENEMVKNFAGVIVEKSVTVVVPLDDEEYTKAFSDAVESVLENINLPEEEEKEDQ